MSFAAYISFMASMLLFFNVYVQENDNYVRKRKQRKHRKEVKQNAKNEWDMKDLIHLHFVLGKDYWMAALPLDYQRYGFKSKDYFTY